MKAFPLLIAVASLGGIDVFGSNERLLTVVISLLFLGGFGLLLASFYFLVFELIVANHRVEHDRLVLEEEVEERKQIEAALRDSKERYSRIFDNTEEGIVLLSEHMKIVQFNPRFAEMLGYSLGDLTRIDPLSLVHAHDRERVAENHRRLIEGEAVARSYEFRMFDRKGRQLYLSGSFDLIKPTPNVLCVHAILRDITQRIRAQEAQLFRLQLESIISTTSSKFISSAD
jgi:PAS domain S-box-containing protein